MQELLLKPGKPVLNIYLENEMYIHSLFFLAVTFWELNFISQVNNI